MYVPGVCACADEVAIFLEVVLGGGVDHMTLTAVHLVDPHGVGGATVLETSEQLRQHGRQQDLRDVV